MGQPTPYERGFSFSQYEAQHPSDPLPGDEVDSELNALKATTDEIIDRVALIQRDDGELANASVGLDQLKPEVSIGVQPAVAWESGAAYLVNAMVFNNLVLYRCITAHTAGVSFDASKFVTLADLSSLVITPGSVGTTQLADGSVTQAKLGAGAVSPDKLGSFPGSALFGRYNTASGGVQYISLGAGLAFSGNTLIATAPSLADGSVTTAKLAANAVTSAKMGSGAAVANIGYTPLNKAGDTISGNLIRSTKGGHLYHQDSSLVDGGLTISTSAPSGGVDGNLWFQVS